jgi:hypothetical protein
MPRSIATDADEAPDDLLDHLAERRESYSYTASLILQGKHRFYTLSMPSDVLAETCVVDTRDDNPIQGFQRVLVSRTRTWTRQSSARLTRRTCTPTSISWRKGRYRRTSTRRLRNAWLLRVRSLRRVGDDRRSRLYRAVASTCSIRSVYGLILPLAVGTKMAPGLVSVSI